ncbi:unnamed protein product [Cyclocybe aegerita]|uniref:Kri1-like C-terminal domain-containing protein n=1 Tax=Cyclocybe aegerita TaxID=1973307 RepID=A0A8S0VTH7_CYCAE|nr:unnamed protein product [Cyclocybe aegerita]
MSKLFSDDEGPVDDVVQLTINEHYAKAFEYRKEREELEQLEAKYGSDYDPGESSTDSESAESEDEDGEELTPAVDAAILRTLARIKKKDPAIYNSQKNIFGEEREKIASKPSVSSKTKTKSKPVTIRQANLESMLHGSRSPSPEADDGPQPLTHVQEQEKLRKETISAFHNAVGGDDGDDFLIPREKTKDEQEREEEEYRAFLEREVGDLRELVSVDGDRDDDGVQVEEGKEEEEEKEGEPKKKKKKKSKSKETADQEEGTSSGKRKKKKAEEDQEFLMNYILNRGWIDRSEGHIPTYKEITTQDDNNKRKKKGKAKAEPSLEGENEEMDTGLLSDSSFESLASHFEVSYNHRFEEPGAATIPSYPRKLVSTVRREDTKRKEARERKKERKEEELAKKREEVKRLKALKMREVKRKLEMIGRQGGLERKKAGEDNEFVDEALKELDLEGDWNPDQHDRQMSGLFDREVDGDDDAKVDEDGKPVWDDDIDIGDIPMSDDDATYSKKEKKERKKEKKKKKKKENTEEDVGVDIDAMDADVQPQFDDEEEWDGTEEMRKRKLDEYMDEIYGLEFNDMVGDLPTRFKYTSVKPQTFSLTPVEILLATNQELNEYMGVKRYAPYRQDKETKHFTKSKQEKLHEIKQKVTERSGGVFAAPEAEGAEKEKKKKRKGKKERMKAKGGLTGEEGDEAAPDGDTAPAAGASIVNGSSEPQKKAKKRKRDHQAGHAADDGNVPSSVKLETNGALGVDGKRNKKKDPEDDAAQEGRVISP